MVKRVLVLFKFFITFSKMWDHNKNWNSVNQDEEKLLCKVPRKWRQQRQVKTTGKQRNAYKITGKNRSSFNLIGHLKKEERHVTRVIWQAKAVIMSLFILFFLTSRYSGIVLDYMCLPHGNDEAKHKQRGLIADESWLLS